ncbi:MAG: cobalamin biosynthesis protein CbiX [Bacteroidetes bacterium]|nr:MAG: cobalamin biosynthesis protein CbiX [Bacteroidota bacterium]
MKNILAFLLIVVSIFACNPESHTKETKEVKDAEEDKKVGVLLVNHGSHSATWRQALLDLDSSVRETILADERIADVKTAFMEYTEPSIATRMKEFDKAGYTDVIVVPVFLTVSSHSFDDIPTIIGLKEDPVSAEHLKLEKIEVYKTQATCHVTPLLDFTDILQKNILKRVKSISRDSANEGLVLIAYGDQGYDKEWSDLMDTVGDYVARNTGIESHSYGWCGHIAHYDPRKTTEAIQKVLESREQAIVVPVLVAHDETFQIKIIGDGIKAIPGHEQKVIYKPDAILPDTNVSQWIIDIVKITMDSL